MLIKELISTGANVQLVVTPADLKEFAQSILNGVATNKQPEKEEKLYTAREFAKLHGVSCVTLWRWTKAGLRTPGRVGGRIFYREFVLNIVEG